MKEKIGKFIDSKLENLQSYLQEKKFFISHLEIRSIRHLFQRIFFGFSTDETYSLYLTVSTFLLPRLERFKEVTITHPIGITFEEWQKQLDLMIFSLRHTIYEEGEHDKLEAKLLAYESNRKLWYELRHKGYLLIGQQFRDLWW